MKSYLGVKLIRAEPQERNGYPGYKVVYTNLDGSEYVSWSPADVFEAAYLPLENPTMITQTEVDAFLLPAEDSRIDAKTTLVRMDTITGFVQHEVSSCVDPANYDHALGVELASKRIKSRVWPMLGFVLQWGRYGLNTTAKTTKA